MLNNVKLATSSSKLRQQLATMHQEAAFSGQHLWTRRVTALASATTITAAFVEYAEQTQQHQQQPAQPIALVACWAGPKKKTVLKKTPFIDQRWNSLLFQIQFENCLYLAKNPTNNTRPHLQRQQAHNKQQTFVSCYQTPQQSFSKTMCVICFCNMLECIK